MMDKNELNKLLECDLERYGGQAPSFKDWLVKNESWYIFHLIKHIRYVEYHKMKGGWHKLAYLYHWYYYKRLSFKLHITLYPGTIAGGLRIYHVGDFTHIGANCTIGRNCTIVSGVVFGNKHEENSGDKIEVGDNCYFGIGAKIIGSVKIGNNVTVGANAVVVKNIPNNAVVGGIPAKVLRYKQLNEKFS